METEKLMELRKWRGMNIAKTSHIVKMSKNEWAVPSQSKTGAYTVKFLLDKKTCTCPDFMERGLVCKHIFAVEISRTLEVVNNEGIKTTITKTVKYSQDWTAYNKAQTNEKSLFMKLLYDLVQNVEEKTREIRAGRPELSMRDMLFSSALKVFSTFSLRRFMTDIKDAKDLGYVEHSPHFTLVSVYMKKPEMTGILQNLITLSSLPLKAVEEKFAIDSTGFRLTRFTDYCKEKHSIKREHTWVKAHLCCGVKTNIVTGVEVTDEFGADNNQFAPLTQRTSDNGFTIKEMSADKAYSSRDNVALIDSLGGTAYIPFRSNASGKPRGKSWVWRKMFNYFVYQREEFMEHYHLRSNIETTNFMIKAKFGDVIRSKDKTAQVNEVLLKVLCHNIVVLIQEMFELNIEPEFLSDKTTNEVIKLQKTN